MQPELQPIQTQAPYAAQDVSLRHNRVLTNTYWLLALSLIPTAIGAAIGTNIELGFLRTSPILSFFAILAVFYGWIFAIEKNRNSAVGVVLLLGFTLFLGLLLGPLFQKVLGFRNGTQLVMLAAGGTAADDDQVVDGAHQRPSIHCQGPRGRRRVTTPATSGKKAHSIAEEG